MSVEIPKKQKAAVYDQPGTVSTKIVELDVPEPGPGEVLINLYVACPCYTYATIALFCICKVLTIAAPILASATPTLAS